MTNGSVIRLGTRGSALAMKQASMIKQALEKKHPNVDIEVVIIQTTGDQRTEDISTIGGKGVFIKEIEQALLENKIDCAVHSFKDITSQPHNKLTYSAFLLNERVNDAFILFNDKNIESDHCLIATGSMRRKALCAHLYPNVECVSIRGNIDTRIDTARELNYDGLILSAAGLQRLNREDEISFEPDPTRFIPAPGQGMLAIQNRANDTELTELIQSLREEKGHVMGCQYYEFLQGIAFNCNHPLGGYISNDQLHVFIQHQTPEYMTFHVKELSSAIDQVRSMVC
ncbi:hydroxymethylbilane synthase [Candidatus Marinamargulisbacteria bacterium SCGC AG-343-K17]|nr:hydroxymethylbilane synthase [Candidatus Marinamargulisbacteria bacterium SCGC AG-343-K17]